MRDTRSMGSRGRIQDVLLTPGLLVAICLLPPKLAAQPIRPPIRGDGHVHELARFLESAEMYAGIDYRNLSVFPIRLRDGDLLAGRWSTMDEAISSGILVILEKGGGGQVPLVQVQNRSRQNHVLIMAGELLSGGKQTRTVRQDVIVAPGQRVDVPVWCVEKRRWEGGNEFGAGQALLPQSIYRGLREGADQQQIWDQVARNNAALGVETATESLHAALNDAATRQRVQSAHRRIVPDVPADSTGFVFVVAGRAAGAEFFGHRAIAHRLLPKLIDSYMVDLIIQEPARPPSDPDRGQQSAIELFERIRRGSSQSTNTPGAGTGIRMVSGNLLGEGVGLDRRLVHFGVQPDSRIVWPHRPQFRDQTPE